MKNLSILLAASLLLSSSLSLRAEEAGSLKVSEFTFSFAKPWVQQQVTNSMRAGQFLYDHEDESLADVELVLSTFGGDGGGIQANIDRWVGQFEGTPETKTEEKEMGDKKVTLFTAKGTFLESMAGAGPFSPAPKTPKADYTMLAAILPSDQGVVFLKLTGPTRSVDAMGDAFLKFLASPFAE